MSDPIDLYNHFSHIGDIKMQNLPGGMALSGGHYQHCVSSWGLAGKSEGTWYAYFHVQVDSTMFTGVFGTMKLEQYRLTFKLQHPVNPDTDPVLGLQLVAVSPDTTEGSSTCTSSISEDISSSVGIFGDTPTASLGVSTTVGHSVSRSIPDITVDNKSMIAGQEAAWILEIQDDAGAQTSDLTFTSQMLFRVPTKPGVQPALVLTLDFAVQINDHDENGTDYYDRMTASIAGQLGSTRQVAYGDRGCSFVFPTEYIQVEQPAVPDL
jgi:hypothetical protein